MDWVAIGAIGETLGGIAVIGTLIYLGRQIKHSLKLTRATQKQARMDSFATLNESILTNPELRRFLYRMQSTDAAMRDEDVVLARHYIYLLFNIYNSAQSSFDARLISRKEFEFFKNDLRVYLETYPALGPIMRKMLLEYPDAMGWEIYSFVQG